MGNCGEVGAISCEDGGKAGSSCEASDGLLKKAVSSPVLPPLPDLSRKTRLTSYRPKTSEEV